MNTSYFQPAHFVQTRPLAQHLPQHAAHGFTLIELLMVLAVAAVLLTTAVPTFSGILHSSKLTTASNALLSSMLLARSEAIKRNSRVTLCKSADGVSCAPAGGWEQGWIVFHDVDDDGQRSTDEAVVEHIQPLTGSLRITGNSPVATYVSFVSTGTTRLVGGGFQAGTVTVCDQANASSDARQIIINAVGRARVQKVSGAGCS